VRRTTGVEGCIPDLVQVYLPVPELFGFLSIYRSGASAIFGAHRITLDHLWRLTSTWWPVFDYGISCRCDLMRWNCSDFTFLPVRRENVYSGLLLEGFGRFYPLNGQQYLSDINEIPKRQERKDVICRKDRQHLSTGATCKRDEKQNDKERNHTVANCIRSNHSLCRIEIKFNVRGSLCG